MEAQILNKARDLFFNYGLKSVSMDDVAKEAGVSKKTIYQLVTDKAELVTKVACHLMQHHTEEMERCNKEAQNAVEEVALQTNISFAPLAAIRYSFFYDMEKFFPQAWQLLVRNRREHFLPNIIRNLKRGMQEGVYRPDLDLEMIPQIRLQQLQSALQPGAFPDLHNNQQLLLQRLTRFYLHGITSPKGSELITKYLTENKL
ncbi:TetR/AcrR family transcriptional regulator [Paracnuella aquatica]|uniref:TetR/AcrR family transcriptional regulator n=1 Tax=Paracnuella aquatica TaxID=2268757 RepID=UPI000DF004BC|nr:TetR/AcrR family transcriptional regulator [Paracnuella aquatica]RPD48843.1 TetR/AcrR family transcriptional regulator [Paracnuella aquatica]